MTKKDPKPVSSNPHRHEVDGGQNKRDVTGKIYVSGEIRPQIPPGLIEDYKASNSKSNAREDKRLTLDKFTLGVLIFYAALTFWLAWTSQKIVNLTRADQRPFVWVAIQNPDGKGPIGYTNPNVKQPVVMSFWYQNYGRSPAIITAISYDVEIGDNALNKLRRVG